jgi:hypothetical protein
MEKRKKKKKKVANLTVGQTVLHHEFFSHGKDVANH